MSLILDALNRSRREVGEVPGLDSQHRLPVNDDGRAYRWWAVALVLALGIIAFLLYDRAAHGPAPAVPGPPAPPLEQPAPAPQIKPEETPQAMPLPEAAPAPPAAVEQAPASPVADAEVAALYAGQSPAAPKPDGPVPPATSEQPVDIEAMLHRARDELENARLDEHPAPFLASLSQQTKDGIPTIFYERHAYSGKPGQSTVVLNGKTLGPGGSTDSGVRVEEILADSVVLSYRGTEFRLRALNSWVNL